MNASIGYFSWQPDARAQAADERPLTRWMRRHRPHIVEYYQDSQTFGNVVMTLEKAGLLMRFVIDRGDLLVDVGREGRWTDVASIDAFGRAVPASEGRDWPDFDPFGDPERVLRLLDDPRLDDFLREADRLALIRRGLEAAV